MTVHAWTTRNLCTKQRLEVIMDKIFEKKYDSHEWNVPIKS